MLRRASAVVALVLAGLNFVHAAAVTKRQDITTLSSTQVAAFKPFTYYASAAYCNPSATLTWSCGANCDANPGFVPVAAGGNGDDVQFWYVGFDPKENTVIVAHEGTNTSSILSILTDADFFLTPLSKTLFPGLGSNIQTHMGFGESHARIAAPVLAAVQKALSLYSTTSVTVVGHSLGAAIALIDSIYLRLKLPNATVKMIGYGLPRVGNQAFADYVDAHQTVTHVNNKKDPIPIVPGRLLGFHHPSGEVHIQETGEWDACPGQDNTSKLCIVGDVPNIFEADNDNHNGLYDGVHMGCSSS
ncbi:lipase [Amylostereum chailletii]|nr:lipase [Amylostereum chailletii]